MKACNALLPVLAATTLIFAGAAFAQDQASQMQAPQQQTPSPSQNTMQQPPAQTPAPAQMPPPNVTVRSVPPAAPQVGAPPSFNQLSGGKKWITEEQASAYPPLANDFLNASHGANRIGQAQYEAWAKQAQ